MPEHLRTDILELCETKQGSLKTLTETDHLLGKLYSATTLKLIETVGLNSSQVAAIGCHGQTVRHIAPGKEEIPTSLQIGDANILCRYRYSCSGRILDARILRLMDKARHWYLFSSRDLRQQVKKSCHSKYWWYCQYHGLGKRGWMFWF